MKDAKSNRISKITINFIHHILVSLPFNIINSENKYKTK